MTACLPRPVGVPELPITFEIPALIESQNKTTYSHWRVHHADKTRWYALVGAYLSPLIGAAFYRSKWEITRLFCPPRRELDFGNLVGGAKPLIDCLTEHQIIVDDKPKNFECVYAQRPGSQNLTTIVLLDYVYAP